MRGHIVGYQNEILVGFPFKNALYCILNSALFFSGALRSFLLHLVHISPAKKSTLGTLFGIVSR